MRLAAACSGVSRTRLHVALCCALSVLLTGCDGSVTETSQGPFGSTSAGQRPPPGGGGSSAPNIFLTAKRLAPHIPTKTGMILGMGETNEEIVEVMKDLRAVDVDILTLGQYLRPSDSHIALDRYVTPEDFRRFYEIGMELGFHVTLVRDGTAARSHEALHAALNIDGPTFAHEILTTAELVSAIKQPASASRPAA